MGKLKNSKIKKTGKEYSLDKFQVNFLKALVMNRNSAYNQYQSAIQAFLSYLGNGWGVNPEEWEFSVDLEKGTVELLPKSSK